MLLEIVAVAYIVALFAVCYWLFDEEEIHKDKSEDEEE